MIYFNKDVCTFVQHVLDEVAAGRFLNTPREYHSFGAVFSPDGNEPRDCFWIIGHDGALDRRGGKVPTTRYERHLLRQARRKIMQIRHEKFIAQRKKLRDYP